MQIYVFLLRFSKEALNGKLLYTVCYILLPTQWFNKTRDLGMNFSGLLWNIITKFENLNSENANLSKVYQNKVLPIRGSPSTILAKTILILNKSQQSS